MALVKCEKLKIGYDGRAVCEDIDLSLEAGDYLCVVGENGSGKSTLMKTVLGLTHALSGSVTLSDEIKHGGIGYLPQQSGAQKDFPASAYEIVSSGCRSLFLSRREKAAVCEVMKKLGIEDIAKKCYRELSGGQQQRVLLARALLAAKGLIVLDEPAAGLDPIATEEMYSLIEKLNREEGIAVIMISHDIRSAIRYASHILHIGHGKPFFGTVQQYVESDVCSVFLNKEDGEVQEDA